MVVTVYEKSILILDRLRINSLTKKTNDKNSIREKIIKGEKLYNRISVPQFGKAEVSIWNCSYRRR